MESDLSFQNPSLLPEDLPQAAAVPGQALERVYLRQQLISNGIFFAILLIGALVILTQVDFGSSYVPAMLMLGGWTILFSVSLVSILKGFRHKSYAVRERDILYRSGWLWRKEIVIPFNRVQHCEVSQGPIEKWLKLAQLKVFTAGGQSADLTIPGIHPDTAQQLKDFVIKRTGVDGEN